MGMRPAGTASPVNQLRPRHMAWNFRSSGRARHSSSVHSPHATAMPAAREHPHVSSRTYVHVLTVHDTYHGHPGRPHTART